MNEAFKDSVTDHHWRTRLWIVVVILMAMRCTGCGGARPPDWDKIMKGDPVTDARLHLLAPAPKTSDTLVVYLDTNKSMKGYLAGDKQKASVFSRTLQELRNLSTTLDPPLDVYVRRVSAEVSLALNETFLSEASINQRVFDGNDVNLAEAIEIIGRFSDSAGADGPTADGAGKADIELLEKIHRQLPVRFHILVTDGVQSTRPSSAASCLSGSDQICLRKKIVALLNRGYGAYVIGLRSEFKGKIQSEINGAEVPYETKAGSAQTYRPFYLYVFSPDRVALDRLMGRLRERLRPLLVQDDALRVLALTSTYADGWGKGELNLAKDTDPQLKIAGASDDNPSRLTLKVSVDTERGEPKPFCVLARISWTDNVRNSGAPQELASLIKWDLVPIYPITARSENGVRLPEVKLAAAEPQPDGAIKLPLTAQWPRADGTPQWRAYRLEGRLSLNEQTPVWIKQWSTDVDTRAETANRTLFLESALLGLCKNPELEKQIVAEVYLLVGPE
jgi:hypothetical protein